MFSGVSSSQNTRKERKKKRDGGIGMEVKMDQAVWSIQDVWQQFESMDSNFTRMNSSLETMNSDSDVLPSFDDSLPKLEHVLFERPLISQSFQATSEQDVPEFAQILIQVVNYDDMPLVIRCFHLLVQHYSQKTATVRHMMQTQIVTIPEVDALRNRMASSILDIRSSVKYLASSVQSKRIAAFNQIHKSIQSLMLSVTVGEQIDIAPQLTLVITEVGAYVLYLIPRVCFVLTGKSWMYRTYVGT